MQKKFSKSFLEFLYKNTTSCMQTLKDLPEFTGDIFEQEHPFDILNELYPEGWSTGVTSLVLSDLQDKYPSLNRNLSEHQYINSYESPERYSIGSAALFTYISTDKYLELTGRTPSSKEQELDEIILRDWTGVKFCTVFGGEVFTIEESISKDADYFTYCEHITGRRYYTQEQVDYLFDTSTWMEIAESPISELDLLKSRLDILEDLCYNTIDAKLAELQELLKPKEDEDLIKLGNGRIYSRSALRSEAEKTYKKFLQTQLQKYKFKEGDIAEAEGIVLLITKDQEVDSPYLEGVVILNNTNTPQRYYVGYKANIWDAIQFTKTNIKTT